MIPGQWFANWRILGPTRSTRVPTEPAWLCECVCGVRRQIRRSQIGVTPRCVSCWRESEGGRLVRLRAQRWAGVLDRWAARRAAS